MDMSEEAFVRKLTRKMPDASPAASVLCEPAQSKYTWTCHKRHFVQKFTGKMPNAPDTTSIEHRALTPTVRTPHCGHTVWGIIWNNMYVSAVSKMFLVPTCRITARPGIGHMVVSVWLFLMLRIKGISASEFPRMLPMAMAVQSSAVAVPWHGCGCGIRMPCWGRRTEPDRNSALYMDKPFPSRKHILCAYVADAVYLRDPRLTRKKTVQLVQ